MQKNRKLEKLNRFLT